MVYRIKIKFLLVLSGTLFPLILCFRCLNVMQILAGPQLWVRVPVARSTHHALPTSRISCLSTFTDTHFSTLRFRVSSSVKTFLTPLWDSSFPALTSLLALVTDHSNQVLRCPALLSSVYFPYCPSSSFFLLSVSFILTSSKLYLVWGTS